MESDEPVSYIIPWNTKCIPSTRVFLFALVSQKLEAISPRRSSNLILLLSQHIPQDGKPKTFFTYVSRHFISYRKTREYLKVPESTQRYPTRQSSAQELPKALKHT